MAFGPIGVPDFRIFWDADALWISGTLDTFSAERLCRLLPTIPPQPELVIDVSDCELINHRALLAFDEYAGGGTRIHFRNASPTVRRVWELLGISNDNLRFD
jgi:hypothetical protein